MRWLPNALRRGARSTHRVGQQVFNMTFDLTGCTSIDIYFHSTCWGELLILIVLLLLLWPASLLLELQALSSALTYSHNCDCIANLFLQKNLCNTSILFQIIRCKSRKKGKCILFTHLYFIKAYVLFIG